LVAIPFPSDQEVSASRALSDNQQVGLGREVAGTIKFLWICIASNKRVKLRLGRAQNWEPTRGGHENRRLARPSQDGGIAGQETHGVCAGESLEHEFISTKGEDLLAYGDDGTLATSVNKYHGLPLYLSLAMDGLDVYSARF
jgi:hypothetical protein